MVPLDRVVSILVFLNAGFVFLVALYVIICGRQQRVAIPFFVLLLVSSIYAFAYGFELGAHDARGFYECFRLKYVGVTFVPFAFLYLALVFTTPGRKVPRGLLAAAFALSAGFLALVETNDVHRLFFSSIGVSDAAPFPTAAIVPGPFFLALTAYYVLSMAVCAVLYIARFFRAGSIERGRLALMIASSVLALVELALAIAGKIPWNLDGGPFLLMIISGFMAYGILRVGLFDIAAIARKKVFRAMDEAVFVLLSDFEILDCNPAASFFFPDIDKAVPGANLHTVLPRFASFCSELPVDGIGAFEVEVADEIRHLSVNKIGIAGSREAPDGIALIVRDITEERKRLLMLEELATRDDLTGILNRRQWTHLAEREYARSRRNGMPISVLMIDIDRFKEINDTWGHAAGDDALRLITKEIADNLRITDCFGRLGGEEFAILLPETDPETAALTAERLRAAVASVELGIEGRPVSVTISLGIASLFHDDEDPSFESVLVRADGALYRAKQNGRNRVEAI